MTDLYQAITSTVKEEADRSYHVPWPVHTISRFFESCHHVYWSFKQYRWFRNHDRTQGNPVVYGAALHLISSCSTTIENAIKIGLVAKCATDLLFHYRKVHEAYQNLGHAIRGKYPHSPRWQWSCLHNGSYLLLVPSLALSLKIYTTKWLEAVSKVLICTGRLFKEMFELSMRSRDIYLLTQSDDLARFRAYSETFAEWDEYRKKMGENTQFLQEELDKRKELADRIMQKIGLESRSANFLAMIAQAIGRTTYAVVENGAEFLEPIFTSGKITPITFAVDIPHTPELPPGRYPPWIGHVPMPKPEGAPLPVPPVSNPPPPQGDIMQRIGGAILGLFGVS